MRVNEDNSAGEFCRWLSGFLDAIGENTPTSEQVAIIKTKLNLVQKPIFSERFYDYHPLTPSPITYTPDWTPPLGPTCGDPDKPTFIC